MITDSPDITDRSHEKGSIRYQIRMKQTIQGVIYDTDTAILIGEDPRHGSLLFRTEDDEFFIYHEKSGYKDVPPYIEAITRNKALYVYPDYTWNQVPYCDAFGSSDTEKD